MARKMPDWPIAKHYGNPDVCSVGLPVPSRLPGGEEIRSVGGESAGEDGMSEHPVEADETYEH